MKGLNICPSDWRDKLNAENSTALLTSCGDIEIIAQYIGANAVAWLEPAENPETFEYYFVISGSLELECPDGEKSVLNPGDSFSLKGLEQNVYMRCLQEATVLYATSSPTYTGVTWWHESLMEQLKRIKDKDHYTQHHSRAVMEYSVALYNELSQQCEDITLNDFVVGCLFHDIGKCNIPEEILNKPGKLTADEYETIKQHPAESRKILEAVFNPSIADLASKHHERLDGSGYPEHLRKEDISFAARILMVADSFDAMTRDRIYRKAVSITDAAMELYNMPEQYDRTVTEALLRLIRENRLVKYPG